jgi:cellulose synthase/poly-beta-1,6-N-acetylglucosamine synthase-like glycosyltransferase
MIGALDAPIPSLNRRSQASGEPSRSSFGTAGRLRADATVRLSGAVTLVALPIAVLLVCFALRRVILLVAAAAPRRATDDRRGEPPVVTLIVPARNESAGIDETLEAITALDYPIDRLSVVLVDDASDDDTAARLDRWASCRPYTQVVRRPRREGKPRAVEAGMAIAPSSVLVALCDADIRMRPDYLRHVVAVFADPTVGGAVGYLAPANALASPTASYAAVESWLHQLVTSAGKNRLDLNPPTLGGAPVFRRAALDAIGGLGPAATGDDVRATVALTRAGWRTRFVEHAVADNAVAGERGAYWRQHIRWTRDLYATSAEQRTTTATVPLARRVEAWMISVGYLDRVVLLAAIGLAASGRLSFWIPTAYLAIAALEVAWAIRRAGAADSMGLLLFRTVALFPIDVAGTVVATLAHLTGASPARSARSTG